MSEHGPEVRRPVSRREMSYNLGTTHQDHTGGAHLQGKVTVGQGHGADGEGSGDLHQKVYSMSSK